MENKKEIKLYKTTSVSYATEPDAVFFVKGLNDTNVRTYITTLDGQAIPLQDLTGGVGGITTLTSNDGSITITGTPTSKNIQLSSALQNLINNALQSGDDVSSLINDAGYITLADVPTFDPTNYDLEDFNNLGADKFVKQSELPTKTSDLINDGADGNSTYVEADELGDVAISNDYNDLDNKPTIPSISGLATEVDLNNHTNNTSNPHNVTKSQVGLGSVDDIQQYPNTNPSGFETPAQLNIRDTNNRARANHTGTQAISTITGLQTVLDNTLFDKFLLRKSFTIYPNNSYNPSSYNSANFLEGGNTSKTNETGIWYKTTTTAGNVAFKRRNIVLNLNGTQGTIWNKIKFDSNVANSRFAHILTPDFYFAVPTNVSPTTLTNVVGFCKISTSTNLHILHNDATGTATTIDLGSGFPATNVGGDKMYVLGIKKNLTSFDFIVVELNSVTHLPTGNSTTVNVATDIPAMTGIDLRVVTFMSNNTTAAEATWLDYNLLVENLI